MKLCLNMIVKNESARIERCLQSVLPFVSCWSVTDTGSSDSTKEIVEEFFAKRKVPGKLAEIPFKDFATTRNAGIDAARSLDFDYHLLVDADMQLMSNGHYWPDDLQNDAYYLLQRQCLVPGSCGRR